MAVAVCDKRVSGSRQDGFVVEATNISRSCASWWSAICAARSSARSPSVEKSVKARIDARLMVVLQQGNGRGIARGPGEASPFRKDNKTTPHRRRHWRRSRIGAGTTRGAYARRSMVCATWWGSGPPGSGKCGGRLQARHTSRACRARRTTRTSTGHWQGHGAVRNGRQEGGSHGKKCRQTCGSVGQGQALAPQLLPISPSPKYPGHVRPPFDRPDHPGQGRIAP